jgi:hypothetical protein
MIVVRLSRNTSALKRTSSVHVQVFSTDFLAFSIRRAGIPRINDTHTRQFLDEHRPTHFLRIFFGFIEWFHDWSRLQWVRVRERERVCVCVCVWDLYFSWISFVCFYWLGIYMRSSKIMIWSFVYAFKRLWMAFTVVSIVCLSPPI